MHKGRVESMVEENRKLINEGLALTKNIENHKTMIGVLEKQKINLEKELMRYTKVKVKSNIADAEIHQKKAMQEISEDGANRMRQIYDHNMKSKSTMTYLRGLKHQLVMERTWDEEQELLMKKVPVKNVEMQTVKIDS